MNDASTSPRPAIRLGDFVSALGVFALTAVVFWPAARWLATQAFAREQLKQSFIIVLAAGAWIAFEKRRALRFDPQLSNTTILWFLGSYLLAAISIVAKNPVVVFAGLVMAAGGAVSYAFGQRALRRTWPLLLVFALLIACVLLFPVLDWPLRRMAGIEAANLLKALGFAPELGVWLGDPPPKLILRTAQQTFLVATECNGFGLITSGLLLGLIRLLYFREPWHAMVLLLPGCVAVGFVCNFLRITAIVLLAPRFSNHYMVLHETAGYIALYAGLGAVWWITGRGKAKARVEAATGKSG